MSVVCIFEAHYNDTTVLHVPDYYWLKDVVCEDEDMEHEMQIQDQLDAMELKLTNF